MIQIQIELCDDDNGNALFMHFCNSNHKSTMNTASKKQQHQRAEINFMLMRIQKGSDYRTTCGSLNLKLYIQPPTLL